MNGITVHLSISHLNNLSFNFYVKLFFWTITGSYYYSYTYYCGSSTVKFEELLYNYISSCCNSLFFLLNSYISLLSFYLSTYLTSIKNKATTG